MAHCRCPNSNSDSDQPWKPNMIQFSTAVKSRAVAKYEQERKCSSSYNNAGAEVASGHSAGASEASNNGVLTVTKGPGRVAKISGQEMQGDDGVLTKFSESPEIVRKMPAKNTGNWKSSGYHCLQPSSYRDDENPKVRGRQQHLTENRMWNEGSAADLSNRHNHNRFQEEIADEDEEEFYADEDEEDEEQTCDQQLKRQVMKSKIDGVIEAMKNPAQNCRREERQRRSPKLNANVQNFIQKMMRCEEVRSQKWLTELPDREWFMIRVLNEMKMQGMKICDEQSFLETLLSLSRQKSRIQGDFPAESNFYQRQAHSQGIKGHRGGSYIQEETTVEYGKPCNLGMQRRMLQQYHTPNPALNNSAPYNGRGRGYWDVAESYTSSTTTGEW